MNVNYKTMYYKGIYWQMFNTLNNKRSTAKPMERQGDAEASIEKVDRLLYIKNIIYL